MSRFRGAALLVLAVAVTLIAASPAAAQSTPLRVQFGVSATGPCPPCKYAGGAGVTTGDTVYLFARATRALPAGARLRLGRVKLDPTSGRPVAGSRRISFCSVGVRRCRFKRYADTAIRLAYRADVVRLKPTRVLARSRIVKVVWTGPPKNAVLPRLVRMQRGTGGPSWTVTPSSDSSQGSASYLGQSMSWVMPLTIERGAQGRVNAHINAGTSSGSTSVTFTSPREFGAHVNGQPAAVNQTVAAAPNGGSASASTTITFDPTRRFTPGERFTIGLHTDGPEILLEYVAN